MPALFSSLFNSRSLLQIFDRVLGHDVYDLRKDDNRFSFLSSVGLIVLFVVIYTAAHSINSKPALGCSTQKLFSLADECDEMWFALAIFFAVIAISYILVMLLGKQYSLLSQSESVMENSCSLYIFGCFILIVFNKKLASDISAFNWVSDLALRLLGTSGTANNIIGVFVVAVCTVSLSTFITIVRRYRTYGAINVKEPEPIILAIYYLAFVTVSLTFTFYQVG